MIKMRAQSFKEGDGHGVSVTDDPICIEHPDAHKAKASMENRTSFYCKKR